MEAPVDVVPSVEAPIDKNEDTSTKPALTPPTSEDMDKREERMSSELSELDSDYDDGEEIEPDHYFEGGKIPVFKPTMDQFRNFKRFVDKVDKYGMKSGIIKVVPPKEWRDSLPDLSEAVKTIKVKNPIMQEFAGQHGVYTQANIEKQRTYNLPEWRSLTDESHHQPPAKRGERRKAAAEAPTRTRSTRAQASSANADDATPTPKGTPTPKRGPGRPRRQSRRLKTEDKDDNEDERSLEVPPTPKSPSREEKKTPVTKIKKEELDDATPTKPRGRQPRSGDSKKSTASRRMNNRSAVSDYVDEAAFENFDYHLPGLDEFSVERCKELEENYWRTINYGQPMYGADMPGSLFDERTTSWNVAKLPNLLDVLGTKVPGVNTAYLYLGMWKATFAWHLEDVDLYSINYIHFGAPKQWYSISQEDARRFEMAMKNIWPRDAKNCSQFLRHKTYLISPQRLEKDYGIKVNRLVHYEGEFVITYPYGYHSGYNIGYNCAESVNFANETWLNYGRIAKKCECESDSVWVDVNEIERKLRGEPTPEYYEETDDEEEEDAVDHLPSPPPSVAGKSKGKAKKASSSKRKRANGEPKDAPKSKKVKRIRIRIKIPGKGMPCVLCPNDIEYDELLPTDTGMKAHRMCADFTPETYISTKPNEVVCNVANIGKDRLELKCNYCRSKRGAVFQCSQKKCTRAFHATCAAAAGVQIDLGPMPTFDEEGTEYFYDGYDFRCRFHRPKKRNKTVDIESLEKDKFIMNYAKTLKPKDVVQFQYVGGELYQIYGALVIENRPGEQAALVEVLPDGDRVEVEWKYLLKLHPDDSQRLKPSANAKPLPEHLKESDASLDITNRTDGVPEIGDPFHDPNSEQKWAEWHTAPEVTQRVTKVDFSKENRLWYYLGKNSTEARPQYTENPRNPKHNPKSNFLDTVKPVPVPVPPIERRSYPASYPIQPAPPRTPMQMQHIMRPGEKPYQYKPREPMTHTWKSPVYAPDTRKNPNSPVAHQPNVVYDHRGTGSQQIHPAYPHGYHNQQSPQQQQYQYQPYVPPQNHSSSGWKPQSTTSKAAPNGITQYSHTFHANQGLPQYPFHSQNTTQKPRELPPFPTSQVQGSKLSPAFSPTTSYFSQAQVSAGGGATASNTLSNPSGTSKIPIPNGGFTSEWMPKPPKSAAEAASRAPPGSQPGSHGPAPSNLRPAPQFQSAEAFQRDMAKAPQPPTGAPIWEQMLKHLSKPAPPNATTTTNSAHPPQKPQTKLAPPASNPSPSTGTALDLVAPAQAAPPAEHNKSSAQTPTEPQRPIPSPLSDAPKSPKRPEYSPISDNGKNAEEPEKPAPLQLQQQQIHNGETWRFSSS